MLSAAGTHNNPFFVNKLFISKLLDFVFMPNKKPAPLNSIISSSSFSNFFNLIHNYLAF